MPDDPRRPPVEALATVTLEHARTGQPIVVDLRDYLAGRHGRYAQWRLLGHGAFIAPPPTLSEGGPPDPEPGPDPEPDPDPDPNPTPTRRRRRKHRRSRS